MADEPLSVAEEAPEEPLAEVSHRVVWAEVVKVELVEGEPAPSSE